MDRISGFLRATRLIVLEKTEKFCPHQIIECQWQKSSDPNRWYLAYRIITCFAIVTLTILSLLGAGSYHFNFSFKWFIYLTNWGLLINTAQSILGVTLLVHSHSTHRKGELRNESRYSHLSFWLKAFWVLNSVATVMAFGISAIYWTLIHNPAIDVLDLTNISAHFCNSIFMGIDLLLVRYPFKMVTFLFCESVIIVYVLFNLIYYFAGGTSRYGDRYIYKVLDWQSPEKALIFCVSGTIFLFFLTSGVWLISFFRRLAHYHLNRGGEEKSPYAISEINSEQFHI